MTYEERKHWLCQQCGKPHQCGYVNRGLQDKCPAIQEKMEGWELGYQDAIDSHTGGELLYVLNKGRKIGYDDAVEKACKWLKKAYRLTDTTIETIRKGIKDMEEKQ